MEPENHIFEKENHLPKLRFCVPDINLKIEMVWRWV